MQTRGPAQQRQVVFAPFVGGIRELGQQRLRGAAHTPCLRTVDAVAAHELVDRDGAHILMMAAPQQVVEHAQAQRAVSDVHAVDVEFGEHAQHDRQPARQHRDAVRLQPGKLDAVGVLGLDQRTLEALQSFARDAVVGRVVVHAVELDQLGQRARRAGRSHRLLPAGGAVLAHQHLDLAARGQLGLLHRIVVDVTAGEEGPAMRYATDVQALHQLGLVAAADDEFGRATADVHHQPVALAGGRIVRGAQIDQPRLFAPRDDFDREAERVLGLDQELGCILGDAQRIGRDRTHLVRRKVAQAVAEAPQRIDAAAPRGLVQVLVGRQASRQPHGLTQGVDLEDLARGAVGRGGLVHPPDHQAEAVRAHVDGGEQAWSVVHRVLGELVRVRCVARPGQVSRCGARAPEKYVLVMSAS
ncbi:hypothetical protein D9M72_427750 [compost metagenome]